VAQAPAEGNLPQAARWTISVPPDALDGLNELYLQVKYTGDIARFSAGDKLLTDNFYNGEPWLIGLRRFMEAKDSSYSLTVLPLWKDAPIYLEVPDGPGFAAGGQVGKLDELRLVPEYELVLTPEKQYGDR
jgi:hypothetical protein